MQAIISLDLFTSLSGRDFDEVSRKKFATKKGKTENRIHMPFLKKLVSF